MAIDSKEIIACSRRCVIESMRISFRYSLDYPYVSALMLFLIAMYRAFPSLFAFLLSSSPVILCTAILLGFLLNYSETNEISSLKATSAEDVLLTHKDESFVVDAHVEGQEEEEEEDDDDDEEEEEEEEKAQERGTQNQGVVEREFPIEKPPTEIHFESEDDTESSSTDASLSDIIPMLEELHPLLDSDTRDPAKSIDDSANGDAMNWTPEDQKNLMDLGTSEIERNQRLENLIAKRRAKRNIIRFETEKDLIDLNSTVDDLYRFRFQISPITATRRNPFDLSCDSDEITGLPAVPGSAPSILLHERNPFDVCYSLLTQSESCERDSKFDLFPESDMASSLIDQEHSKKLLEEEIHQESELLSSDSAHVEHDDHTMDLNTSMFSEGTYGAFDAFEVVEEKIGEEGLDLPVSDSASLEVNTSPPSSPEVNEKSSKVQIQEELTILEPKMGDSLTSSSDSIHSLPANSSLASRDGVSSIGGSFHMMPTIDEESSHTVEWANKLTDEDLGSSSESHSAASFDSSSTDDNEFKSSEINEIKEQDVIKVSEINEDEVTKDSLVDASFQSEGNAANSFTGPLVSSDHSTPSIPKENLDDRRIEEEHESMIDPPLVVSSTGLQMIEEHVEEQELSISEEKLFEETETIDNVDISTKKLVSELGNDNVSVITDGEDIVEPRESTEISSLTDTKDEVEIKLSSAISDSRGHDFADINDLSMLSESAEQQNVAPAEIEAVEGIGEGLLSEFDVVGNFCSELKSDQVDLESPLQYPVDLKASEPNAMELEVGSSSWLAGGDPEMTVYNPTLHVLEASSFEELDSAFRQFCEIEMLSGQETAFEKSTSQKTEDGSIQCDTSELQVLEAKSIDDLNYAFKQLSKVGIDESVYSEAETVNLEPMWSRSELQVIEATSIEDIRLALKDLSDGTAENKLKPVESTEESQLDFMQTAAMESGSSYQQTDDKLHGTEVNNDGDYPK